MYIEDTDFSEAERYAEETNNTCILRVFPDGRLIIYDKEREDAIETTVNEFLGYNDFVEDDGEITPQDMGFRQI